MKKLFILAILVTFAVFLPIDGSIAHGSIIGRFAQRGCDRAYPDVCIPSPPPDLDCADISYRNFKVLSPDPHRFDRDKDGIGCEKK